MIFDKGHLSWRYLTWEEAMRPFIEIGNSDAPPPKTLEELAKDLPPAGGMKFPKEFLDGGGE